MLLSLALALGAALSPVGGRADSTLQRRAVADSLVLVRDSVAQSGNRAVHGLGFGIDMNSLANEVAAGLQVYVPVSSAFAFVARPMLAGGASSRDLDIGGRLEVQLESPVFDDLLRVYLGVGPQGFYEIRGDEAHSHDLSGGWAAGVEVFLNRHFAVHWEMGTSGGDVTSGAGPAFSVGFRAYPGEGRRFE